MGLLYESGVYRIALDQQNTTVYCDAGGWTVVQSRGQFGNPIDYFYRGWEEYLEGFGQPGN